MNRTKPAATVLIGAKVDRLRAIAEQIKALTDEAGGLVNDIEAAGFRAMFSLGNFASKSDPLNQLGPKVSVALDLQVGPVPVDKLR